ncbi:MAG: protein-L-isoaspartate(D-aspartate) O-methyltransferase [Promethearchaeota archaeon]
MSYAEKRRELIDSLVKRGVLSKTNVIKAMLKVPRHLFLPEKAKSSAYIDSPLLIGKNQTISAPHMNAMMCEYLDLKKGDKVLEIGTGSGYHAALCAELVAPEGVESIGHVFTIEYHEELAKSARIHLKETGYEERVTVVHADGTLGLEQEAPFDKILVTAASPKKIPQAFKDQLKDGGLLCIPAGSKNFGQSLFVVRKQGNAYDIEKKCGVRFVPLLGRYGFK